MAEFIGEKDKNANLRESVVFENKTDSAFEVSAGIVFHKSGIYEVSVLKNKTIVSKVTEQKKGEWLCSDDMIEKCKAEFLNTNVQRETETQTLADQSFARGWNACNRRWISELSQLPSKVVAEFKVDTDEIMERLEQEWYKPNEWIPCSERLPDAEYGEGDSVLCCTDDNDSLDIWWNRLVNLENIWEREHKFWKTETSIAKEEYDG